MFPTAEHFLAWLSAQHALAALVMLAGTTAGALLAPRALLHGRRGWYWGLGIAWCLAGSLWAAQFIVLQTLAGPVVDGGAWRVVVALGFAFAGTAGALALARAELMFAAGLMLGTGALSAQLAMMSGVVPADALVFSLRALAVTLGASLGSGLLFLILAYRAAASTWGWRLMAGLIGGSALEACHRLVLYLQTDVVPDGAGAAQGAWLGTAVGVAALVQVAFVALIAWVETRLDAGTRAAQVNLDDTRARLEREAAQRREMAAAHAESEERFRSAFDEAAVGMTLLGADLRWVRVNRAFCEFLGYEAAELRRAGFAAVTHPDDIEATQAGLGALAAGEIESFAQRKRYITFAGQVVHGDMHVSVARREHGKPREFVAQVLDVTARVRVEAELADSEARFRSAFEDAAVAMALVDAKMSSLGRFLRVNDALCELLGYGPEELLRTDNQHFVPAGEAAAVLATVEQGLVTGGFQIETRYLHRSGRTVWVRLNVSLVHAADGTPAYFVGQYEDITARKEALDALERANAELARRVSEQEDRSRSTRLLGDYSQLLQSCGELGEAYGIVARFGSRLLRGSAGHLYMTSPSRDYLEHTMHWGEAPVAPPLCGMDECWALRRGKPHLVGDDSADPPCPHAEGRRAGTSLCLPLVAQNDTLGLLWLEFHDTTGLSEMALQVAHGFADRLALALANLRLRQTLRDQSIRDQLTGLYNRRFFEESLARELARAARAGRALALLMLDVDHFKRFNDAHGHDAGDTVLRTVASELAVRVRGSDVLCRYGGEEFVALLPEIAPAGVLARAEELRAGVAGLPIAGVPGSGPITVSVGAAIYPRDGADGRALLRAADQALYAAKSAGRNRVMLATHAAA